MMYSTRKSCTQYNTYVAVPCRKQALFHTLSGVILTLYCEALSVIGSLAVLLHSRILYDSKHCLKISKQNDR